MEAGALQHCQALIGYNFSNPDLLQLALTHASVALTRTESNERLEFLGDAVLGLAVCHELYSSQKDLLEGDMTKIKSAVVSRQTCANIAEETGISELVETGKGMTDQAGLPMSVMAAVFEAIVGAIYLDGGLEPAMRFILRHARPHIDEALTDEHQRNYKSALQQHAQRLYNTMPQYLVLDEKGPDHNKAFEVAVVINGRSFSSAWGKSKKEAEQEAARKALMELGLL
ncbi:MAG TPA: ribonuclease III [Phycisphaerae bacterium]|nr:ribonuclease III [Phycisphaerae bacterium]